MSTHLFDYATFDLHIGEPTAAGYPVVVIQSPAGEGNSFCTLDPVTDLSNALGALAARESDAASLVELGAFLFDELLSGDVLELYRASLSLVRRGPHSVLLPYGPAETFHDVVFSTVGLSGGMWTEVGLLSFALHISETFWVQNISPLYIPPCPALCTPGLALQFLSGCRLLFGHGFADACLKLLVGRVVGAYNHLVFSDFLNDCIRYVYVRKCLADVIGGSGLGKLYLNDGPPGKFDSQIQPPVQHNGQDADDNESY